MKQIQQSEPSQQSYQGKTPEEWEAISQSPFEVLEFQEYDPTARVTKDGSFPGLDP